MIVLGRVSEETKGKTFPADESLEQRDQHA